MGYVENMWNGEYVEALKKVAYEETIILGLICGLIGLVLSKKWENSRFPPGPFALPLVGHVHHLINFPHQNLRTLAEKYGPIVGLRLGQHRAVAVSSVELAKEVLVTKDKVFANRPPLDFTSVVLYGCENDVLFGAHGPRWRKQRKLCALALFTPKRLQELELVRQEEMAGLLLRIQETSSGGMAAVDIGRCVGHMSTRLLLRMLHSKASLRLGSDNVNVPDLIREIEEEASRPTLGDLLPFLSFLDFPRKQRMRRLHARVDTILSAVIADRKQNVSSPHDDLLHALLSKEVGHDSSLPPQETFTLEEIKGILLDILTAGIHTTSFTIEWAMAELLKNPRCLQRLRREIDTQLGRKKQITDADVLQLSYLKCVVKEVFRLHPGVPLLLPRISNAECKLNGYVLPANTRMFVNVWAIGRDETLWSEAKAFMPERFEGKDIDVKGQNFELLPFGSGRRICAGMPLALSAVEVTVANLVNSFNWELPHGETHTSISMTEYSGITGRKATPIVATPKPRAVSS